MLMSSYEVYARADRLSREEWLEKRRSGIGGSDAGAIMGVNPYKGAFTVWADKLGKLPPVEDNERMRQGREFEEYVARRFTEKTGKKVRRCNLMMRSTEYPWMLANIDRRVEGAREGVECKVNFDTFKRRYRNGEFPLEYYCQCLHYLTVTGWDAWHLAVWTPGEDVETFSWRREDVQDDIDMLIAQEEKFWRTYIEGGAQPMPDGLEGTADAIGRMYERESGEAMDAADEDEQVMLELIDLKAQRKELDGRIRCAENRLKARMGEAMRLCGNAAMATWKAQTRRIISEKRIRELYPMVDVEQIREAKTSRVFKVEAEEA